MRGAPSLLIVEDEPALAASMGDYLVGRGYLVDHAADGHAGLRMALDGRYDAVVLDLGLPRLDGLEVCRRLRESGHGVPVLMVTARHALEDKLKGFVQGADDYLAKPFALGELAARLAVLSRQGCRTRGTTLSAGGLELDSNAMVARRDGVSVLLTRTQARLLGCLMEHAPDVVGKQILQQAIWGAKNEDATALQTHVHALRGRIDKPFSRRLIHSCHGIGYRLLAEPQD